MGRTRAIKSAARSARPPDSRILRHESHPPPGARPGPRPGDGLPQPPPRPPSEATPAPRGAAPAPLARYFPKDDLIFLLEFDGLDAHAAGLAAVGDLQDFDRDQDRGVAGEPPRTARRQGPGEHAVPPRSPRASSWSRPRSSSCARGSPWASPATSRPVRRPAASSSGAARPPRGKTALGFIRRRDGRRPRQGRGAARQAEALGHRGREHGGPRGMTWSSPTRRSSNADAMLAVLDKQAAQRVGAPDPHEPWRRPSDDFETALRGFVDFAKLPPMPPQVQAVGARRDQADRLPLGVPGRRPDDQRASGRAVAAARGLLAFLDGPTFTAKTLPPIPAGARSFVALAIDPAATLREVRHDDGPARPACGPEPRGDAAAGPGHDRAEPGGRHPQADRPEDGAVLRAESRRAPVPLAPGVSVSVSDFTLVAESSDPARFGKSLDAVMGHLIQQIKDAPPERGQHAEDRASGRAGQGVRDHPGHRPLPPFASLRPTVLVGNKLIVYGLDPRPGPRPGSRSRARPRGGPAAGDYAAMTKRLPKDMILLSVSDPHESLPPVFAALPDDGSRPSTPRWPGPTRPRS